ncbi:hypothetical protein [Cohnella panacarvi]|uniref:hypothetical protein n=1 Tax=Cohnella panacarvi TaxID=400776 RepID=UPI00047BBDB7|nr:hypothetical protein [Cohnella panacarvi]
MKFSWKNTLVVISVIAVVLFSLSYIPQRLININNADVSKLIIFDGNTGEETEITTKSEVDHIIDNLREITFQKGKPTFGFMGYSYKTTIYNKKGKSIIKFIINSEDTIRYNGFFFKAKGDLIDYSYIKKIIEKGK